MAERLGLLTRSRDALFESCWRQNLAHDCSASLHRDSLSPFHYLDMTEIMLKGM